jgi:hypothetical protein
MRAPSAQKCVAEGRARIAATGHAADRVGGASPEKYGAAIVGWPWTSHRRAVPPAVFVNQLVTPKR